MFGASFEAMKDDSPSINTLTSNNCFCHRKITLNGVNTISNMVNHFLPIDQNFVFFLPYDFVQISPACGPNTYQYVWRDFGLPMSASVMLA